MPDLKLLIVNYTRGYVARIASMLSTRKRRFIKNARFSDEHLSTHDTMAFKSQLL